MLSFRALIENSCDVIALMSSSGHLLYASAASSRVFGYGPEELVGRSIFDLLHPADWSPARRSVLCTLSEPSGTCGLEARVRRRDGSWCLVEGRAVNLLHEPRVSAIAITCREISVTLKAAREKQLREAEAVARAVAEMGYLARDWMDSRSPESFAATPRRIGIGDPCFVPGIPVAKPGELQAHQVARTGLDLCRVMVESLGGSMGSDPQPDGSTTLRFTLPATMRRAHA